MKTDAVDAHERHKDFLTEVEVESLRAGAKHGRHGQRDDVLILLIAHSGDLDRVFRRIAIRCRECMGRFVTTPSGELADLSIRDSRQAW